MSKRLLLTLLCLNTLPVYADILTPKDIENRMQSFTIPKDMEIKLWADPSLTKNPTFFSFDSQGRLMMSEIYRINKGVDDVRGYSKELTIADIYIETNDERLKMYNKFDNQLPPGHHDNVSDKIRFLEDTNQDGKADKATLYADGFDGRLDGLGSGVIERNGTVYYTNIPNLWALEDTNNDGVSDKRTSLQDGFGTRVSFMGHDMHGLAWGPEGRLYWSLGDRGYSFTTKEGKKFHGPNQGAIFRSNADGSNLEVFYHGVRNPQELVFDEHGNLFTADNDGDHGDTERVNHLIEGGDSGWHAGHQSIMSFTSKLGLRSSKYTGESNMPVTWIVNNMSAPRNNKQPAYMLPGIGQLFTGPSGFTYNPSNYLGEKWRNNFFVALYGGSPAGSYVSAFKNTPNGASFLTTKPKEIMRGMNVTDIDFGPDGQFYISEFNFGGWEPKNEGAIYTLKATNLSIKQTETNKKYQQILTSNFNKKTLPELSQLLAIDHQTIRQKAQFAMVDKGNSSVPVFNDIALNYTANTFSRIHSIWGLSQLVLTKAAEVNTLIPLVPLLNDSNDQVRIQTARVLSSHASVFAESALIKAINDKHNQVAMYAAYALGKINSKFAVKTLINKLESIKDKDLWLRHSITMALKGIDKTHWINYKNHQSKDVRLGILLTLRLLSDNDIAYFLNDNEKSIVDEAITAIDDKALTTVRPKVAELLSPTMIAKTQTDAYMHHRIINANFNEGKKENAVRLLNYAAYKGLSVRLVSEALAAIEGWNDINPIDTITGLPTRATKNRSPINNTIKEYIPNVLKAVTGNAQVQAMRLAQQVNYVLPLALLEQITKNESGNLNVREQALATINKSFNNKVMPIVKVLLNEDSNKVKSMALTMALKNDQSFGLSIIEKYLASANVAKQKIALSHLTSKSTSNIDKQLITLLKQLLDNKNDNALTLELITAANQSTNPNIKALLTRHNTAMETADVYTQFADTLTGGDIEKGKDLVFGGGAAQCIRCHKILGKGSWVGPDLTNIATKRDNRYLLEALIEPSAAIAPGYGSVTLTMNSDELISGLFFHETSKIIIIGKDKNNKVTYNKKDIKTIQRPVSGMPPMKYILSKAQIRDIMAYLATLKHKIQPKGH